MIDLHFFFRFLEGRCHGKIGKNDLYSAGWRSETDRIMTVLIQKYSVL